MAMRSRTQSEQAPHSLSTEDAEPREETDRYREALLHIGRIAGGLIDGTPQTSTKEGGHEGVSTPTNLDCRIMLLPARLREEAAEVARRIYPVNAPLQEVMSLDNGVPQTQRLTLATTKYWGPKPRSLTVSFMETTSTELKKKILSHLNAWSCGLTFAETGGTGEIRISRGPGGYWSYLGTDNKLIPNNRQTMNLQGFTLNTPESEYRRVVRHESGHASGFPHEHMRKVLIDRIDPQKAYDYFAQHYGWSRKEVDQQVLTPLDKRTIIGTEPDQDSVMCYHLPGSITKDGQPISGGPDINDSDAAFADIVYPAVLWSRDLEVAGEQHGSGGSVPDWDPSDDVALSTIE